MDADHEDHVYVHPQIFVGASLSWTTDGFYGRSFLQEIHWGRKDSLAWSTPVDWAAFSLEIG